MTNSVTQSMSDLSTDTYNAELVKLQASLDGGAALTASAFELLISDLESNGNNLSNKHRLALFELLAEMTGFVTGIRSGRRAYGLPTGAGKTSAIIAWITTLYKLGMNEIAVSVSAFKVAALCDIKKALIARGVPEELIGIKYSSNPGLPFPSTGNDDRRYQLVTHARVHGGSDNNLFVQHKGKARAVMIYDESLIKSDSGAIPKNQLMAEIAHLSELVKGTNNAAIYEPILAYLHKSGHVIEAALQTLSSAENKEALIVKLEPLQESQLTAWLRLLKSHSKYEYIEELLNISRHELRISKTAQGSGLVWYEINIPPELKNILILDASYPIRRLVQLDSTIIKGGQMSETEIKRFDNVTINHMKANSGRESVQNHFKEIRREDRTLSSEIIEVIKCTDTHKPILIFTFKQQKGQVNVAEVLLTDIAKAGIDTEAVLEADHTKKRINILTWGEETSLNSHSHCEVVILAGVLHLPLLAIASKIVGQHDNLEAEINNQLITEVQDGELAHMTYQAISRGCCRIADNGQARAMEVYLIHKNLRLKPLLDRVMPGARWCNWTAKFDKQENMTLQAALAKRIQDFLNTLPNTTTTIPTHEIKEQLLGRDAGDKTILKRFNRAIKALTSEYSGEWLREGHSLFRLSSVLSWH